MVVRSNFTSTANWQTNNPPPVASWPMTCHFLLEKCWVEKRSSTARSRQSGFPIARATRRGFVHNTERWPDDLLCTACRLLFKHPHQRSIRSMNTNGLLENIARFKTGRSKRISSYQRNGGNLDYITIGAGETVDIAHIRGAGIIKHIWITTSHGDPMHYRNMILRMYWDDETKPSVESSMGDFFGQGWGEIYQYVALPICASPKRAMNSYFSMPFRKSARIEIENDSEKDCTAFYYYVDYEERDKIDDDLAYFHAQWRRRINVPPEDRENEWTILGGHTMNLTDARNHHFIDAVGRGHYVGMNYYVQCPTPVWYGEGDDMFFIDGEKWPPSLHGTGTEDYFNSSYCPTEVYNHPYFGYARVNKDIGWLGRTHCYRFHIEDPIIFQTSLRGS